MVPPTHITVNFAVRLLSHWLPVAGTLAPSWRESRHYKKWATVFEVLRQRRSCSLEEDRRSQNRLFDYLQ
ncbi:MAG: hypothetical protein DWI22_21950 [Planctomycetota bacterium]|nr:MAG: hypothetical protein DWI22_21950 [Planctomycetota bacterium]